LSLITLIFWTPTLANTVTVNVGYINAREFLDKLNDCQLGSRLDAVELYVG
jgi:hypothetical protein